MKPLPPPQVPGATDAERMKNAVRQMFSVSKDDYLAEEARLKRTKARKRVKEKGRNVLTKSRSYDNL